MLTKRETGRYFAQFITQFACPLYIKKCSYHLHVFYSHVTKAGKRLFKNGNYLIAFV